LILCKKIIPPQSLMYGTNPLTFNKLKSFRPKSGLIRCFKHYVIVS